MTIDGVLPTNHAEHETLEITHGFNEWFECGFYQFTSIQAGRRLDVGGHAHPAPVRRAGEVSSAGGPEHLNEIGYQRPNFSADTWTWEIRPIIDKKIGKTLPGLQSDVRQIVPRARSAPRL